MKSVKPQSKRLIACLALISVAASLKAGYYKPDFFPIGLTGLNFTGSYYCPYANADVDPPWDWTPELSDNNEKALIDSLGVNCIGCRDAQPTYLLDFDPTNPSQNNYLHKVCVPSFSTLDSIYLITASYYVENPTYTRYSQDHNYDDAVDCDSCSYDSLDTLNNYSNQACYAMFRSPYRGSSRGFGDMQLSYYDPARSSKYNCHGTHTDNWDTFDGGEDTFRTWQKMADTAVVNFQTFFENNDSLAKYIWGYNLINEDPAIYRRVTNYSDHYHGCWAAVDYIFTGHRGRSQFTSLADAQHGGIRAVEEDSLPNFSNRMIIAKGQTWPMHKMGYDIFASLPEIDAFVVYSSLWPAHKNYGNDSIMDHHLYGSYFSQSYEEYNGFHHTATYFQTYGGNSDGPDDQKRRWIATLCLEWQIDSANTTIAAARRPCPPEIRCATYLALSRGAKGVLFHPWSYNYPAVSFKDLDPSTISIPSNDPGGKNYNLGLRDQAGYPFGEGGPYSSTHKLNGGCSLPVWDTASDTTYAYLAHSLIPEIKKITPTLMQLDWVNGYSLKSTDDDWEDPCPHVYIKSITTTDSGYIDLGFFDDPNDAASEYFMIVNRDGIADMTDCIIEIVMSGWDVDKIKLTDMSDTNSIKILVREPKGEFSFQEVFEPGEGKLYRVRNYDGTALPEVRR